MSSTVHIKDRSIRYTGPGRGYKFDIENTEYDYAVTVANLDRLYAEYTLSERDHYLNLAGAAYWASVADTIATQRA